MLNWLKATVIKTADWINEHNDPFDEFTRPIIRRSNLTLAAKEKLFSDQLLSEFKLPNGVINYRKVYPPEPLDLGDQCIWHGINTGNLAMKSHVTQDPDDLREVESALEGMKKHYRALSDGTPYLIRGVDPDHKDRFEENASNDSLTGHVYGLYMVWKWCPSLRDRAAAMIEGLARSIIKGGFAMVNHDGKPTTYGQLIQGWKTDPLRLTLCLALLVLAHSATGSHAAVIRKLAEDYKPILMYPKVRLLWWDTKYDTHRSAIHLSILADLAVPGLHEAIFKEGLMRIWLMQRKEADPWLLSLISEQVRIYPPEMVRVVSRINEYEFEERGPILERLNSLQKDYWKAHGAVRIFEYPPKWIPGAKPKLYASQPLPFWMMHSQDFFPQRDLRSVDGWQGSTDGRLRHSGADFIGSYWRLRAQGHIKEGE